PAARPDGAAEYKLADAPAWQVRLPAELHEISGLAVTEDGRVFAHGDEDATVYQIDPRAGTITKRFGLAPTGSDPDLGKKKGGKDGKLAGDFEDIAVAGDRFYLVTSNGVLLQFKEGADGASVPYEAFTTPLADVCEVEGLAHDPAKASLLVLCKTMEEKSEREQVAVYDWSLDRRSLSERPRFSIPWSELTSLTGDKEFNGSAITVRPGGGSLFLIAGPQRLFAETAPDGKPVRGGAFAKETQPQPESVAFLPDGTLLVASEGGKGVATLAGYSAR
ncbi:MAG TPA: hypothetical protein VEB59_10500, partial [Gemmatimonadales bacterium]|nr:hypothetical protein [Gemmatimonadales bacterium]